MLAEIEAAAEDSADCIVRAVSIEGGSPCLTAPDLLRDLLRTVRKKFACAEDVQIGLQTMPGDYSRALVQRMADEGVNFWTVGLQTADRSEHNPQALGQAGMVVLAVHGGDTHGVQFRADPIAHEGFGGQADG